MNDAVQSHPPSSDFPQMENRLNLLGLVRYRKSQLKESQSEVTVRAAEPRSCYSSRIRIAESTMDRSTVISQQRTMGREPIYSASIIGKGGVDADNKLGTVP